MVEYYPSIPSSGIHCWYLRDSCKLGHPMGSDQWLPVFKSWRGILCRLCGANFSRQASQLLPRNKSGWSGCSLYVLRHQQAKLLRLGSSAASYLLKDNCGFSLGFPEPSYSKNVAQLLPTINPEFPDEWNHLSTSQGLCGLSFSGWLPSYFGSWESTKSPKLLEQLSSYFTVPLVGKVPWYCYSSGAWMSESRISAVLFLWVLLWCGGICWSRSSPNWA